MPCTVLPLVVAFLPLFQAVDFLPLFQVAASSVPLFQELPSLTSIKELRISSSGLKVKYHKNGTISQKGINTVTHKSLSEVENNGEENSKSQEKAPELILSSLNELNLLKSESSESDAGSSYEQRTSSSISPKDYALEMEGSRNKEFFIDRFMSSNTQNLDLMGNYPIQMSLAIILSIFLCDSNTMFLPNSYCCNNSISMMKSDSNTLNLQNKNFSWGGLMENHHHHTVEAKWDNNNTNNHHTTHNFENTSR
ncbi:uncharacterized protein LOC131658418 [Vicia villosa]|uniref:uncharacterized protein LOC131658418 n=1 Tax=Vicia villosa TaxID=3911 RepID=UPI00273CC36B|nr:uncharacterized protein LOC131658418 [Vicia villosa]